MSDIPRELYARVHELALAITNAVMADDEILSRRELKSYHEEQVLLGTSHPFLTETLADFTEDPPEAVRLYQLSIRQSKAFPNQPLHTKRIALGTRLLETGNREQAEAFLLDGLAEARILNDADAIAEAEDALEDLN
ncbi:MAG: hypothetical protein V4584_16450 [Verrucomicrobiota bacterium]